MKWNESEARVSWERASDSDDDILYIIPKEAMTTTATAPTCARFETSFNDDTWIMMSLFEAHLIRHTTILSVFCMHSIPFPIPKKC